MADYSREVEDIKEYYADLLILQYHSKYRARETVKMGVDLYLGDGIVFELQDILDIDNAEGKQLDIIGKILDCPRLIPGFETDKPFFTFEHTGDDYGFSIVGQPSQGYFKSLNFDYSSMYSLPDNDYRLLLKFKAVANRARASWKDLDDLFYNVFNIGKVFNRSAFTIIGSPTITDDGVASGFDHQKSIKPNITINYSSNNSIELRGSFTTIDDVISEQFVTSGSNSVVGQPALGIKNGVLQFGCWGTANIISSKQVLSNTKYDFKLIQRQNIDNWEIYIKKSEETNYEHILDYPYGHRAEGINNMYIGGIMYDETPQESFKGSIDLSQFIITVDSVEVFNGLKEQSAIEIVNNKDLSITYQIKQSLITDGLMAAIKLNYLEPPLGIGYNIVYVE